MIADPCLAICADRCAEDGDPPCWEVIRDMKRELGEREVSPWKPCDQCLRDAGVEPVAALDPAAAIRPLL